MSHTDTILTQFNNTIESSNYRKEVNNIEKRRITGQVLYRLYDYNTMDVIADFNDYDAYIKFENAWRLANKKSTYTETYSLGKQDLLIDNAIHLYKGR